MTLNLYRRHKRSCTGQHPYDSFSGEDQERGKKWTTCQCPIVISGKLGDKFARKPAGCHGWKQARAIAERWAECATWEEALSPTTVSAPAAAPVAAPVAEPRKTTIDFALDEWLSWKDGKGLRHATLRKYRTFAKQLRKYAADRGFQFLDQMTPGEWTDFYKSWKDGKRAAARKLERMRGFSNFCVRRYKPWRDPISEFPENPIDIEPPQGSSRPTRKMPLLDHELKRVYDACDQLPTVKWENKTMSGEAGGEDVKTIIMLLAWTGMRISNGVKLDYDLNVRPLPDGDATVLVRMIKNADTQPEPVYTYVPDWLHARLKDRRERFGTMIFKTGNSDRLDTMTDLWRRKINRVFNLAGPYECGKPTPHIFRHTFVRILLEQGVSTKRIAKLIGDTEEMVIKYYSRWMPGQQDQLIAEMKEKLGGAAPRPTNVVLINRQSA